MQLHHNKADTHEEAEHTEKRQIHSYEKLKNIHEEANTYEEEVQPAVNDVENMHQE